MTAEADGHNDSDEEYEQDLEEDIVDRETLKKQSASILGKATKKSKKRSATPDN